MKSISRRLSGLPVNQDHQGFRSSILSSMNQETCLEDFADYARLSRKNVFLWRYWYAFAILPFVLALTIGVFHHLQVGLRSPHEGIVSPTARLQKALTSGDGTFSIPSHQPLRSSFLRAAKITPNILRTEDLSSLSPRVPVGGMSG